MGTRPEYMLGVEILRNSSSGTVLWTSRCSDKVSNEEISTMKQRGDKCSPPSSSSPPCIDSIRVPGNLSCQKSNLPQEGSASPCLTGSRVGIQSYHLGRPTSLRVNVGPCYEKAKGFHQSASNTNILICGCLQCSRSRANGCKAIETTSLDWIQEPSLPQLSDVLRLRGVAPGCRFGRSELPE